jgi:hypothetical protein
MSKSNYLELELLDHALGTGAFTMPTAQHLALHTANPDEDGSGAELSGTGYARIAVDFNAASGASGTATGPTAVKEFTNSGGGAWDQVTHFGVWDASTSGNLLYYGALTTAKTIAGGDTLRFTAGSISISEG